MIRATLEGGPFFTTMREMKIQNNNIKFSNLLVSVVIVIVTIAAIYISTTFKKMPPILKRGIQPSDFPQLVCGLIIFLTILMSAFDPVQKLESTTRQTLYTFFAILLFICLVPVDLFLSLGIFATVLAISWGEKKIARLCCIGLVVPVSVFFLFDLVFSIRFPRGVLTNLWYG